MNSGVFTIGALGARARGARPEGAAQLPLQAVTVTGTVVQWRLQALPPWRRLSKLAARYIRCRELRSACRPTATNPPARHVQGQEPPKDMTSTERIPPLGLKESQQRYLFHSVGSTDTERRRLELE
ncbi:hypothetical protein O0L34_g6642 [Tuta absoluta]|nr:hypothetical protein O0L34_g6642 [Tuta absoluta]